MLNFLSSAWFEQVAELNQQAGNLNLPSELAEMRLNITIITNEGLGLHDIESDTSHDTPTIVADDCITEFSIQSGTITKTPIDAQDNVTQLRLTPHAFAQVFLQADMGYAMRAFVLGEIEVYGDLDEMLTLQRAKPSAEQISLQTQILALTVPAE